VKGLVADANIQGQVEYLVQRMQAEAWAEFWQALGLVLRRFEDVGPPLCTRLIFRLSTSEGIGYVART
jgi:hypothetical protein